MLSFYTLACDQASVRITSYPSQRYLTSSADRLDRAAALNSVKGMCIRQVGQALSTYIIRPCKSSHHDGPGYGPLEHCVNLQP